MCNILSQHPKAWMNFHQLQNTIPSADGRVGECRLMLINNLGITLESAFDRSKHPCSQKNPCVHRDSGWWPRPYGNASSLTPRLSLVDLHQRARAAGKDSVSWSQLKQIGEVGHTISPWPKRMLHAGTLSNLSISIHISIYFLRHPNIERHLKGGLDLASFSPL